jgi:hypothetical protein
LAPQVVLFFFFGFSDYILKFFLKHRATLAGGVVYYKWEAKAPFHDNCNVFFYDEGILVFNDRELKAVRLRVSG